MNIIKDQDSLFTKAERQALNGLLAQWPRKKVFTKDFIHEEYKKAFEYNYWKKCNGEPASQEKKAEVDALYGVFIKMNDNGIKELNR